MNNYSKIKEQGLSVLTQVSETVANLSMKRWDRETGQEIPPDVMEIHLSSVTDHIQFLKDRLESWEELERDILALPLLI